jgi:hypothetical protein
MPPGAWLASAARSVQRGHQRATAVGDRLLPGAGWDGARSGVPRRLSGHRRRAIYRDTERRRRGTSPTVLRRGQWEAMHGTVSGWYENRPTRPRRATACWRGYGPPGTDLSAERSGLPAEFPPLRSLGNPAAEQSAGPTNHRHRQASPPASAQVRCRAPTGDPVIVSGLGGRYRSRTDWMARAPSHLSAATQEPQDSWCHSAYHPGWPGG